MHKGIYYDKQRKSWYIHTSIKGKTCTIRGFSSKAEADEKYDMAIYNWQREHNLTFVSAIIFDNVANDYIEYVRTGKSSRTADRERTQIRTFWLPRFQGQVLNHVFNIERLRIIYQDIKVDKSLNTRKKHDIVFTFLHFTHYCYVNHLISKEVFEEINIIFQPIHYAKSVEQERHVIPQCELRAFLDTIRHENEKDYILFALLVNCGLRISELLGLCNDCFVDGKVIIKRQLLITGQLSNKLKTQQSYRSIPLNKELSDYFKNFEQIGTQERFYKISHTQFKRLLYYYEQKANIKKYVPHEFRHTCCYELARKCENMTDVVYCAKCMGHSPSVFFNTYANHLDKSLDNKFFN